MTELSRILKTLMEHRTRYIIVVVGRFLIELEIFAIAAADTTVTIAYSSEASTTANP